MVKVMKSCFQIEIRLRLYKDFFQPDRYDSGGVIKNEVCGLRSSVGTIYIHICYIYSIHMYVYICIHMAMFFLVAP